ncbi:MAG: metal-dependent hydrolase [Methanoregulaceae archaeon]|nr:metal-dependent hydrolase [Methanoregulaceae archaeon]
MDVLTHGLTISLILGGLGAGPLLFAGILGTIAPDLDVLLTPFSSRNPRRYILVHGGVTHSLAGGVLAALLAFGIALIVALKIPVIAEGGIALSAGAVIALISGTILHILFDLLAYPGIPLRWPATDRKYTLGIFPGPSLFVFGLTLLFLVLFFTGAIDLAAFWLYAVIFVVFLVSCTALKLFVSSRVKGITIPTRNPLHWLVLADTGESYLLSRYHLLKGFGDKTEYQKFDGVTEGEASRYLELPEIRRLYFHSYIVTVRREGEDLIFRDPLRDEGIFFYPPYYKTVRVGENGIVGT